jgi:hypothetical protein
MRQFAYFKVWFRKKYLPLRGLKTWRNEMCNRCDDLISQCLQPTRDIGMLISTVYSKSYLGMLLLPRNLYRCHRHMDMVSHLVLTVQVYTLPLSAFTLRSNCQICQKALRIAFRFLTCSKKKFNRGEGFGEAAEQKKDKKNTKKEILRPSRLARGPFRTYTLVSYRLDSSRLVHEYLFCSCRISTIL